MDSCKLAAVDISNEWPIIGASSAHSRALLALDPHWYGLDAVGGIVRVVSINDLMH